MQRGKQPGMTVPDIASLRCSQGHVPSDMATCLGWRLPMAILVELTLFPSWQEAAFAPQPTVI